MAYLLSLSTELLLAVFEQLSDLDDSVSLARTCVVLCNIYTQHKATILWSIIVKTPKLITILQLLNL